MKFSSHSEQEPELLTKKEAAELLRVSIKTINNWVKKGLIPAMQVGGPTRKRTLFRRNEILGYGDHHDEHK